MREHAGTCVVLCSRGYSFEDRLSEVMKYAERNSIAHVVILHCPEKKYSDSFVQEVTQRAGQLFSVMKSELSESERHDVCFEFVCRQGLLEENLGALIAEGDVRMVFVGMKMLDHRPEAVKKLQGTAFYFMGN